MLGFCTAISAEPQAARLDRVGHHQEPVPRLRPHRRHGRAAGAGHRHTHGQSIAALNRGKWADNLIIVLATCGIAFPSFVICTVGMYFFGVNLGWLPTFGLTTPAHYVLPVFALSFYPMSYITRLMRSSMLDVIGQDYMRTAKAKGLSSFKCLFKHALRNAILPVVTYLGPMLAYTLTGSFIVEKIFVIPGLGGQFVSSITNRDYTVIMGTTIFLATLIIVMNVLVDIVYKIIDPRIQLQ
jgi:oligopeptide transport system permease protein